MTSTSNCHATCTLSVTSNEAPVNDEQPQFIVVDAHHVQLTAERLGIGTGRTYTITITCSYHYLLKSRGHNDEDRDGPGAP